ncbi:MAG: hypothetical protein K2J32_02240 [Ruminococcus sp.]|nr:hypothetical protein [Ruminococcus sp.]
MNESENIHILIEIINEIKSNSTGDIMGLMLDAVETVAKKINSTPHHVERVLNDVITGGDMRYNLVDFSRIIAEYLTNGNKTSLKELLVKNISEENHDSDLQAIENWYKK